MSETLEGIPRKLGTFTPKARCCTLSLMARSPRTLRALTCADDVELLLKLPSGSVVLVLSADYAMDVRTGTVRGDARGSKVRDLRVERALGAMEREPARRWTVGDLAKVAGLSRAAFARAFRAATGSTPHAALSATRMTQAAELLSQSSLGLAEIAARVGYASEFALSRAFKRHFGMAPAVFRRSLRSATDTLRCAA